MNWTADQIIALAPDASSASAGRGLATPRKWGALGQNGSHAWGECQGSGKLPYQTKVDLAEPAFHCSCPSRKFPCKHGLGLLLMLADQPGAFGATEPPSWVADWVAARAKRAEQKAVKAAPVASDAPSSAAKAAAAAKRATEREEKVAAGLGELEQWLTDLMRRGLASVQGESYDFWERPAARLVDAQAPGLARQVRAMAGLSASGDDWAERLLERLSRLYLVIQGYRRLATLPAATQADIRDQIGFTQSQESLMTGEGLTDIWAVVGQHIETEDRLRVRRSWLWGRNNARAALLLDFSHGNQPFATQLAAGSTITAELVFYPSGFPLRGLLKSSPTIAKITDRPTGYKTISAAVGAYADALADHPWLEHFPFLLDEVWPIYQGGRWFLADAAGYRLPLPRRFDAGWTLLAKGGGRPLPIFGEWDGEVLWPLRVWDGGRSRSLAAGGA